MLFLGIVYFWVGLLVCRGVLLMFSRCLFILKCDFLRGMDLWFDFFWYLFGLVLCFWIILFFVFNFSCWLFVDICLLFWVRGVLRVVLVILILCIIYNFKVWENVLKGFIICNLNLVEYLNRVWVVRLDMIYIILVLYSLFGYLICLNLVF